MTRRAAIGTAAMLAAPAALASLPALAAPAADPVCACLDAFEALSVADLQRFKEAIATVNRGEALCDPILAAIEAHRAAAKAVSAFVDEHSRLEAELPLARREWVYTAWDREPPANCQDDPRWIANELAHGQSFEAMDDAASTMATVIPQTLAGAAALLSYVADRCSESGACWQFPEALADDDGAEWPFAYFVMKLAAQAIGGAA